MTVMHYDLRDMYRWSSVTETIIFAFIAVCLGYAVTELPQNSLVDFVVALTFDLHSPIASAIAGVALVVSPLVAWALGRSLMWVSTPAVHAVCFAVFGLLLGTVPAVAVGVVGTGVYFPTDPLVWLIPFIFAVASAAGWGFAYRRRHEQLDLRWWEILLDNWTIHTRR